MRKLILSLAAVSAVAMTPAAAQAQRSTILVVDLNQVLNDCTACRSAGSQIQSQAQQLQQRATQLENELKPERDAIQQAVQALNGAAAPAALQQRITAFRQRGQAAQTELANSEQTLESTRVHVQRQLAERVVTISEQIRAQRSATMVISKDRLLANDNSIDITPQVLQALNQQLPAVSVTPLPQQQQQQSQPQGR